MAWGSTFSREADNQNYSSNHAVVEVYGRGGGAHIATLTPERRFYKASQQPATSALRPTPARQCTYTTWPSASASSMVAIAAWQVGHQSMCSAMLSPVASSSRS